MNQTEVCLAKQKTLQSYQYNSSEPGCKVAKRLDQIGLHTQDIFRLIRVIPALKLFIIEFDNMRIALREKEAQCLNVTPLSS